MAIYWFEQTEQDIPVENDWLSMDETVRLQGMRFDKRRAEWRLGRWTAKRAVAGFLGHTPDALTLAEIEIRSAPSGAPEVFIEQAECALNLSLSHCSGKALCALTPSSTLLGCDLERVEIRHPAFLTDYFTASEQCRVQSHPLPDQERMLTIMWSAKESALKALRLGLRLDTRLAIVSFPDSQENDAPWHPLQVSCPNEKIFGGWHSSSSHFVRTIVTSGPVELPIQLRPNDYCPCAAPSCPAEGNDGVQPIG
jgi:4'-phosphopantetheinyl transferase